MRLVLIFSFLVFPFSLFAQNFVPNGGFEEYRGRDVSKWIQPGSPYYHFDTDSKNAHTGKARNGLCLWLSEPSEFMTIQLIAPLTTGATYKVEFYALFDETTKKLGNFRYLKAGFLFTSKPVDASYKQIIYDNPQATFILEKNIEWTRYESTFVALGGEEYVTIGYFYHKNNAADSSAVGTQDINMEEKAIMEKIDLLQDKKDTEVKDITEKYLNKFPELKKFYEIINIKNKRKREKEYKKQYGKLQPFLNVLNRELSFVRDKYDAEIREIYMQYNPQKQVRMSDNWNRGRFYFDDIIVEEVERSTSEKIQETKEILNKEIIEPELTISDTAIDEFANIKEGSTIILNNVYFETNKSALLPESYEELDRLVFVMESNAEMEIEISGHTDNTGNLKKNKILSEARAKAVIEYVVARGIDTERLKFIGHGSNNPLTTNDTEAGRAKNRRVECKIQKMGTNKK